MILTPPLAQRAHNLLNQPAHFETVGNRDGLRGMRAEELRRTLALLEADCHTVRTELEGRTTDDEEWRCTLCSFQHPSARVVEAHYRAKHGHPPEAASIRRTFR